MKAAERQPGKRKAFVSFDLEHDMTPKILLAGQALNNDSPFKLIDTSRTEPRTEQARETLRRRLQDVDVVIVLCGRQTHRAAGVAWELDVARECGKKYFLLAAYADSECVRPHAAPEQDPIYRWTWNTLKAQVGQA